MPAAIPRPRDRPLLPLCWRSATRHMDIFPDVQVLRKLLSWDQCIGLRPRHTGRGHLELEQLMGTRPIRICVCCVVICAAFSSASGQRRPIPLVSYSSTRFARPSIELTVGTINREDQPRGFDPPLPPSVRCPVQIVVLTIVGASFGAFVGTVVGRFPDGGTPNSVRTGRWIGLGLGGVLGLTGGLACGDGSRSRSVSGSVSDGV